MSDQGDDEHRPSGVTEPAPVEAKTSYIAQGLLNPADRTITAGVFMSLIGATVVQTGYAFRTIMRYLF